MRHWFGGTPADVLLTEVDGVGGVDDLAKLSGGTVLPAWAGEQAGAQQYTDLLDADGQAMSSVTTASGTGTQPPGRITRFQGPDGVTRLWVGPSAGPRWLLVTTDTADVADDPGTILPALTAQGPISGPLTGQGRIYNDTARTLQIVGVRASCRVNAGAVTADLLRNDSSIFTTTSQRPTIPAGQRTSGKVVPFDAVTLAPGDYLTGSLVSGANVLDLVVQAVAVRAAT